MSAEPRRARLWHVFRLARILWSVNPHRSLGARLGDIHLLARLVARGQITHVPGRHGSHGFLARDGQRVHALYTHPKARRQGVASQLMDEAKAQAKRLELWTLQENTPARAFYAAHGFYPTSFGFGQGNDDNLPDMQMIWERDTP